MAERPGAVLTVLDLEKIAGGDPRQIVDLVESFAEDHSVEHRQILDLNAAHSLLSPRVKAIMGSDLVESSQAGEDASTESLNRAQALLSELGKSCSTCRTWSIARPPGPRPTVCSSWAP